MRRFQNELRLAEKRLGLRRRAKRDAALGSGQSACKASSSAVAAARCQRGPCCSLQFLSDGSFDDLIFQQPSSGGNPLCRRRKIAYKKRVSRPRLIALLLALITLVVYLPASTFSFVNFDDNDYVTANPVVKDGLTGSGIAWAVTAFHAGNWHPLTWISHMLDCELFQLNAGAHHFVNVLFHAANAVLLFALLLRLTDKLWPCAMVAALFAWHPLHVESVAWVSERKDVLSTFFALLALWCYAKKVTSDEWRATGERAATPHTTQHSSLFFWLAFLFFALGLLAKPMLVTLPFVMLLLDFWPLRRISNPKFQISNLWSLVLEKTPFFLLTIASCVVTFFAQRSGEAVASLAKVSLHYRLENAPLAVAGYLQNFFWPSGLCAIYPMPEKISALRLGLSLSTLIVISIAAWRWRNARPYFITGWLWFLGTLVPVIGLVQVGGQAMADRYTYIPSIGFFFAVVFLAAEIAAKIQMPKIIVSGAAIVILAACIRITEFQLPFWRDGETLFRRAVAVTQNNDIALINLGSALEAQGKFEDALTIYRQAEKLDAPRYQLHNNLGNVLGVLGRHEEALTEYRKASELRPDIAFPRNGIGLELTAMGQLDEALTEFSAAARLNPSFAMPHLETAKIFFRLGRDNEGAAELRQAAKLDPNNYQTLANAAHYLAASDNAAIRNGPDALSFALQAHELSGHQQPMVYDILGMAFAASGDFTNAITCAQNALELANAAQMTNTETIQQRLDLYKKNLPWRESFRDTKAIINP